MFGCGSGVSPATGSGSGTGSGSTPGGSQSGTSQSGGSGSGGSSGSFTFTVPDGGAERQAPMFDPNAFWVNDPPPKYCPLAGMTSSPPPTPGGTPECPDDKNRQGCPCPAEGMVAPCWPGARANRNLGICKDGMTTCRRYDEIGVLRWGPCMGAILPVEGATEGAGACKCFSNGLWKIDNVAPCFINSGSGPGSGGAVSTVINSSGVAMCPSGNTQSSQPWSSSSVSADCTGRFQLCLTLKAGDRANPSPNDCVVARVCTEGDYLMPGVEQMFPPLPSWKATDLTCTRRFAESGGYGEMSVRGTTVGCDDLDRVFNRISYCPLRCRTDPNTPECMNCRQNAGGQF
jgi:hypothetical protein